MIYHHRIRLLYLYIDCIYNAYTNNMHMWEKTFLQIPKTVILMFRNIIYIVILPIGHSRHTSEVYNQLTQLGQYQKATEACCNLLNLPIWYQQQYFLSLLIQNSQILQIVLLGRTQPGFFMWCHRNRIKSYDRTIIWIPQLDNNELVDLADYCNTLQVITMFSMLV